MARAYGSNAHLLMKRETAYGQAATGNYLRMPFNRCNLGSEQGLIDDPVLGQGRDPLAPLQDVINDEGDIVVPVDPRYLGLWLTGLFGDPDTTDNLDGSWDHEFASGGDGVRMIDLSQRTERYELELPYGLKVTVKPLTTAGMAAAQAAARRTVEAIERQARERTEAGLPQDGLPDISAEGERDGFYQAQLIRELAVRHIASWTGVELEGGPAPPTPENIAAVMELYPVGERFFQEFTLRQVLLNAAKNGSWLSAAGTSGPAEGPNTVDPAATPTCPAPEASPEPTGGSAPTASTP